jgi:prepilin-type N-terminal cleavage/methylation domain-containing protein
MLMRARLRDLLREDDGFSLMELLVALMIGSIVLTAAMMVFINGMRGTAKVTDRADATARARTTTDVISSLLQAATCNNNTSPITAAAAQSITFTANLAGPEDAALQYRLRWDGTTKTVYEDIFASNGTVSVTDQTLLFPSSPTETRVIGTNMSPQDGTTLFKYYPYDATAGAISNTAATPPVTNPTTLRSIVAIATSLLAQPEHTTGTSEVGSTSVEAQSVVGQVDPSNPGQGTQC